MDDNPHLALPCSRQRRYGGGQSTAEEQESQGQETGEWGVNRKRAGRGYGEERGEGEGRQEGQALFPAPAPN